MDKYVFINEHEVEPATEEMCKKIDEMLIDTSEAVDTDEEAKG